MTAETRTWNIIDERRISNSMLSNMNTGQDIPYVLQFATSMTQSSDAGTGMGYTYLRMRGMDQTRINVTINGAPVNDPESHGVFWVNTPDLTSSLSECPDSARGGHLHGRRGCLWRLYFHGGGRPQPKSFDATHFGWGIVRQQSGHRGHAIRIALGFKGQKEKPFSFMGRYSSMQSTGFVDRSAVDLTSYLISGQVRFEEGYIRLVHFSGQERTQQAWWGIPEAKYRGDLQGVEDYIARNSLDSADAENLRRAGTAPTITTATPMKLTSTGSRIRSLSRKFTCPKTGI